MIRASLLCVLIGASAALSACDLPPATFDGSSSGGTGGSGTAAAGGTGGGGGSTTTAMQTGGTGGTGDMGGTGGTGAAGGAGGTGGTGGTGGGPTGPILQCNYPMENSFCEAGQVCCLDKSDPYEDHCAMVGGCNPAMYGEAKCSADTHCEGGNRCCLFIVPNGMDPTQYDVQAIYCDVSCAPEDNKLPACLGDGDCLSLFPYVKCKAALGYPTYKFCQPP